MIDKVIAFVLICLLVTIETKENCTLGKYVELNTRFSVNVYKDFIKSGNGNIILSPLSARIVLGLTAEGAKGQTLDELNKGLQLLEDKDANHRSVDEIARQFNKSTEQVKILAANKLFVKKDFEILQQFKDIAVRVYHSGIQDVDFSKSQEAASTINNWVEERTNHRIKKLIDESQLKKGTELILVNALYFSGKWRAPFDTYSTRPEPFHTSKTEKKSVKMMNEKIHTDYAYNSELKAKFLKLGFEDTTVSMYVILPDAIDGLASVEENLGNYLAAQDFKDHEVEVSIPKFTIETKIDFIPILKHLGIEKLFNPNEADLSGLSKKKGLYVSFVVQKSYINVTETGAEAAAATGVGFVAASALIFDRPEPVIFKADHPFIYLLKDDQSGIILFIGRYMDVVP